MTDAELLCTTDYRERYLRALNWMRDNRVPEHPFFQTLFDRRCRPLRDYAAMLPTIRFHNPLS